MPGVLFFQLLLLGASFLDLVTFQRIPVCFSTKLQGKEESRKESGPIFFLKWSLCFDADLYLGGGYEETDNGDDESGALFLCPFCAEDFDIVGLCCHIDEDHPIEAKNGRKRRFRKVGSNSTFSILRKELREGNLQSFLGGSSCLVSSSNNTEPDPLLSSFIFNSPKVDEPVSVQPLSMVEATSIKESSNENRRERSTQKSQLSHKDQEEKARKCEFVQGLLLSTVLDDYL
ncbi:hypothetical protein JRO89_XS03G0162100 [Xanthoceras sorbifolium]|uniref:Uncharacterized protein n=1 Tax=Xanthoceras sorbifolium TaxID=99658 RepID=A0ABQ8IAQ3_9ROSI|nr:hypothetical protein JRO89_XS03G0162100 [Xanthoceras sorbifolium]